MLTKQNSISRVINSYLPKDTEGKKILKFKTIVFAILLLLSPLLYPIFIIIGINVFVIPCFLSGLECLSSNPMYFRYDIFREGIQFGALFIFYVINLFLTTNLISSLVFEYNIRRKKIFEIKKFIYFNFLLLILLNLFWILAGVLFLF